MRCVILPAVPCVVVRLRLIGSASKLDCTRRQFHLPSLRQALGSSQPLQQLSLARGPPPGLLPSIPTPTMRLVLGLAATLPARHRSSLHLLRGPRQLRRLCGLLLQQSHPRPPRLLLLRPCQRHLRSSPPPPPSHLLLPPWPSLVE